MKILRALSLAIISTLLLVAPAQAYNPPPAGLFWAICHSTKACGPSTEPQLQIQLPPRLIMMPSQLIFPQDDNIYNFNSATGQFEPTDGLYLKHKVTTTTVNKDTDGAAYVISITGWTSNELPQMKKFRLTFVPTVSKASIDAVEAYIKANNGPITSLDNNIIATLTGPGCQGNNGTHICLETITNVQAPGQVPQPPAILRQTITIKGIVIEGNVAAPGGSVGGGLLKNFSLNGQAIALGRNITNVDGGQTIDKYPVGNLSKINWANVSTSLNNIYAKRDKFPPVNLGTGYAGSSWNLNSPDKNNPANPNSTTFSTPPEGNFWNNIVKGNRVNIGGSGGITIKGSGTLVFSGEGQKFSVIFHEPVICSAGARFGVIAPDDIEFETPANGVSLVGCGAYTSLNGSVKLDPNSSATGGSFTAVIVAAKDVVLPDPKTLQDIFTINSDVPFTVNPTDPFRELLKLVGIQTQ